MKTAYFDLSSGVAGDMILAALLDAGLDFEMLKSGLSSLKLDEFEIKKEKVVRSSISATHFSVKIKHKTEDHHHDHQHDHGHALHEHSHKHPHKHIHEHGTQKHGHSHSKDGHRNLNDIIKIISDSDLPQKVKFDAIKVFRRLGEAEAKVHGVPIEKIHFHEVGAVDSIVDIVGGCLGLHILGIEKVLFSTFYFGSGHVHCAHGVMPLPAPATVNLTLGYQSIQTKVKGELTTPTGAAMMTALGSQILNIHDWKPEVVGYGAGTRIQTEVLGALRVWIGNQEEASNKVKSRDVLQIEFNIDDMTSEQISFLTDKLREISKQDVWLESIYMKKNRLASKVCLLAETNDLEKIQRIVFQESSSFGFRFTKVLKVEFDRSFETIKLQDSEIRIKSSFLNGEKKSSPEYEDCRQYAEKKKISIQQAFEEAIQKFNSNKNS